MTMEPPVKFPENRPLLWLLVILFLIAMAALLLPPHFALGLAGYLPLHTAIETFSVVVAMLIFAVGSNIHREKIAVNLVLLSCAFLAVGLLDFGHLLSSGGMPDFVTPSGAEKAIYFWLAARAISALALLAVAALSWQREAGAWLQAGCLVAALALVAGAYWLILFHQDSLPRVFDSASGLTPFKRGMEYLLTGIMAVAAIMIYRRKKNPLGCNMELLFAAVVVMGLGELFFAAYASISDHLNLLGHIYKIIADYLLYRAIVAYAVHQPYRQLAQSEQQLRASMEHLALLKHQNDLILNAVGEGICGLDTHGTIVFANPAAAGMLGYPVMELFGRSLHDTAHHTRPDGSPYPAADCPILASFVNGRTCHGSDEFYYRRDGSRFPMEYTSTPIIDEGNIIGAVVMFSDITRRRQAEETLRRWQQFVEHATWGMAIGDFESRTISLVNPAYARMHGYRTEEIIGASAWELYAPESRPELPHWHEALKKTGYLSFECERQRKDGSAFPALVDIAILYDAQGKEEGYIANVQDITARRQLEAALRESEELFRTLFGGITDAILVHFISGDGVLGHFVVVNNVACEWLGYTHQEMLGMTPRDIEASDSGIDTVPVARRVAAGESVTFEQVFVARSGKRVPVEITANPFLLHGEKAVISLVRDITERKQSESALRESEERFRTLFGGISDAIFVHFITEDSVGHFVVVNDVACERLGYTRQEMLGMTPLDLDAPDTGIDIAPVIKRLASGESVTFEQVHVTRDGKRIPVELRVNPFLLQGQKAVITVARDITERKHAEQQLRELSAHLQTVREEEKASVAREIHDDLGSTLTALKMDVYWLARMLPAEKEMVPLLERVESLSGLLDDAVAVTRRIISELRPTVLDDLGLLAALEWQCAQFHKRTGIECRVHGIKDDGMQNALDSNQSINLFRISQEALTNVSRHSGASRVEVEFFQGEDEILLSISDNGCGLPIDRPSAATSHGMRGMLERVEHLGGTLKFDSSPGEGTTVTVKLPLPRPDEAAPLSNSPPHTRLP